jgi:isopentenyldiphosphate isomerase
MHDEWFDIINKEGSIIGKAPRTICHQNPGLMHQAVHVLVFDQCGRLFLQKRSNRKDLQPNRWDTSVGGHLNPGEKPADGARREAREELGITNAMLIPAYQYVWRSEVETERITAFGLFDKGPFNLDPDEISEGRFWSFAEIARELNSGVFTPQFTHEFPRMAEWLAHNPSRTLP